MNIAILDSYLTDLLSIVSSRLINILVEGVIMALGDRYDFRECNWQVRELPDGGIMIRYDDQVIDNDNKGRYNTSPVIKVETNQYHEIRFTTRSGSQYYFSVGKCAFPMHLLALQMRFGVEL